MLLGFKAQFAEYVEQGSKTHTIRAPRKLTAKSREMCHCYTGLRQRGPVIQKLPSGQVVRQKVARLLGRFKCRRVQDIVIMRLRGTMVITIDGQRLSPDETELFLQRDGFRAPENTAIEQALAFWKERLDLCKGAWCGILIHWEYKKP